MHMTTEQTESSSITEQTESSSITIVAPQDVGCMVCGGGEMYCEACWNDPGRPGFHLHPKR
jgi:hypothetical protein